MWIKYNPNPRGNNRAGDCTIRAICKLTGKTWEKVFWDVAIEGFLCGDVQSSNAVWGSFLQRLGYRREVVPNTCPACYTVRDFCKDHPTGSYLLSLDKHTVCCKFGNYYDTWDSGDETVEYYWTKE